MSLAEAGRLFEILRADPSSALAAALEGWDHPVSREAAVLMDLWDLEAVKSGAKKPPKYPRVWKTAGDAKRYGNAAGMTREEVLARLGRSDPPV
jgi:hypothetical protein